MGQPVLPPSRAGAPHTAAPSSEQAQAWEELDEDVALSEEEEAAAVMEMFKAVAQRFAPAAQPFTFQQSAPSRNEPCPCGSGQKYKRCHGAGA